MVKFRPFRAVRPAVEYAAYVASLPYDVMTSGEARAMAAGNAVSFLHIDRAEIDFPKGMDPYSPHVYVKARENFERFFAEGIFVQDEKPLFYIYRLTMDGRSQTGLVGCASIDDYESGIIKKHELTRADKEEDRVAHVDALDANTGPIFLTCRRNDVFSNLLSKQVQNSRLYDFVADDGVRHEVWALDEADGEKVSRIFEAISALYIADGHHRCASAARVGKLRRQQNPGWKGDEDFGFFLAVVFPEEQLAILDYNRVALDLNNLTKEEFLAKLGGKFNVSAVTSAEYARPKARNTFGMYLDGIWYKLVVRPGLVDDPDPVAKLDVSILQNHVLAPILGIEDPRTDKRIEFIGGIRGLCELERRVDAGERVAFAMYPTSIEELFGIADAGLIMPPKSTWFEPKLRSGLFIHKLEGKK